MRPMPESIRQTRNMAYKFKLAELSPKSGFWDVNGGILRWLDKEVVLNKFQVRVNKVRINYV